MVGKYVTKNVCFLLYVIFHVITSISCESLLSEISERNIPEDGRLNCTELARKYGLHAEEIEVVTEDGYVITLFHIAGKKKPVLLVHGLGDSSITWLLRGNKSLAVALAAEGHDLWLGNVRGNKYARKHIHLNPDTDQEFWDFSFHEMGYYDWPAMINRVLKETKETKLNAIGHSQGITSFLILMSTKPEYNEKVNLCIGLAPVAFLDHIVPVRSLFLAAPPVLSTLETLGIIEIFSDHTAEKKLVQLLCTQGIVTENICRLGIFFPIAGYDLNGLEPEFMPVILGQFPSGASTKTLSHYVQVILSGKFAYYDYGVLRNLEIYKSQEPQSYDLTKVTAKVALLYGLKDRGATEKDVQHLGKLLPNVVCVKAIENKDWNHIDFIWSSEMDIYLFGHIFKLLETNDW